MSQLTMKKYPAAFKERAVKLAVESDQPIAQTARDLGVNANTLHTWLGKYHRTERQEKQVNDEPVYEALQRLRQENARWQEERDILKKAAASFAHQLPCSPPGCTSSAPRCGCVAWAGGWRSHAVAMRRGLVARPAPTRTSSSRCRRRGSAIVRRGVAPTAPAASRLSGRRRDCRSAGAR